MAVKNTGGMVLDIQAAREQLGKDRDAGRVSQRDYRKASKGLNRMIDAEKKGVNYQFTGDSRFRTDSSNGRNPTRKEGGVGVSQKLPLLGNQVSKAMGYIQSQGNLTVPARSDQKDTEVPVTGNSSSNTASEGIGNQPDLRAGSQGGVPPFGAVAGAAFAGANTAYILGRHGKDAFVPKRDPETFIRDAEDAIARMDAEKKHKPAKGDGALDRIKELEKELADNQGYYRKFYELTPNRDIPLGEYFAQRWKDGGIQNRAVGTRKDRDEQIRREIARLDGDLREKGIPRAGKSFNEVVGADNLYPQEDEYGNPIRTMGDPGILKYTALPYGPLVKGGSMIASGLDDLAVGGFPNPGSVGMGGAGAVARAKPLLQLPAPAGEPVKYAGRWQANRQFVGNTSGTAGRAMQNADQAGKSVRPQFSSANITRDAKQAASNIIAKVRAYGKKTGWNIRSKTPLKKNGGKIRKFSPGGFLLQNALAGNRYLEDMKKKEALALGGNKRTHGISTNRIPKAKNESLKPFDKDSALNTAMGLYGAASLLTAKRPELEKAKRFNMAIRPAMGDEDTVSRSMNSIDESVRGGAGQLRARTGSDLSSYVTGLTAMTDNATGARSNVLGANAQIKRADENRMFGEINQEREINFNINDANRREGNLQKEQIYANRVQGAQAALNNSMNYGVQKRANEANNAVQLKMANKRLEMMLSSEASRMRASGTYTEEQISEWMDNMRNSARSYARGGRISDSTAMMISNNRNISDANRQLMDIFKEYKKLVSMASLESIRQFNANVRAINMRNNITITRR